MTNTVRAIFRAVSIPGGNAPYNAAHVKIYYPAMLSGSDEERNAGVVAVDSRQAPLPIVILLPGINLGHESYRWLAEHFAKEGIVTVTYSYICEEMPGYVSITPGLDLQRFTPEHFGTGPSATTIQPLIAMLGELNQDSVLSGSLDLDSIVVGGHSAGGTVALVNADPEWFPPVKAVFSYGAHSGASTALGFPEDTILPIPSKLPILIIGGTEDGCIEHSNQRYGADSNASTTERVERSFDEGLKGQQGDKYLLLINGANHFSMAHPLDTSTGRPFIDRPTTQPDDSIRALLANSLSLFINAHARSDQAAKKRLHRLLETPNPLIALSNRK